MVKRPGRMCAYDFICRCCDVGDKHGYLETMVECVMCREDLRDTLLAYLHRTVQ